MPKLHVGTGRIRGTCRLTMRGANGPYQRQVILLHGKVERLALGLFCFRLLAHVGVDSAEQVESKRVLGERLFDENTSQRPFGEKLCQELISGVSCRPMHTSICPGWLAAALLAVVTTACASVAVPPVAPIGLASQPLPPAPPPPEVARMKLPPWLRLEAAHGTTHDIHHWRLADAAFTPDGRSLVTLGANGALRVWNLQARVLRAEASACITDNPPALFQPGALELALSGDGLAAVGFGSGRVCVVELASDRLVRSLEAHDAHVVELAFSSGVLFSYGYQELLVMEAKIRPIVMQREAGGEVRWWDPRTGARLGELVVGPRLGATNDRECVKGCARCRW